MCCLLYVYLRPADFKIGTSTCSLMRKSVDADKTGIRTTKTFDAHDDLELYVRTTAAEPTFVKLYEGVLVQSMQYFWPYIASMVVVLDQEKPEDHVFGDAIQKNISVSKDLLYGCADCTRIFGQ